MCSAAVSAQWSTVTRTLRTDERHRIVIWTRWKMVIVAVFWQSWTAALLVQLQQKFTNVLSCFGDLLQLQSEKLEGARQLSYISRRRSCL